MVQEPDCAADLGGGDPRRTGTTAATIEIVEDVDREAFIEMAEPFLRDAWSEEQIAVLDAIQSTARGIEPSMGPGLFPGPISPSKQPMVVNTPATVAARRMTF